MSRDLKALDKHLRHWREQGLVDAELEGRLRQSSRELDHSNVGSILRTALALLGGALVLAGLTLIVGENWMALHRFAKLGGWAALLAASLVSSQVLGRRIPDRPALTEALALVAGGWVLAGIALVSQIYHLDSRPANGLWLWLLLIAPAAWLLERRAVAAVLFVAIVAALALEVATEGSLVHSREFESPWLWLAIPLLAAFVVSFVPHPWHGLRAWVGAWTLAASQVFLLVLGSIHEADKSDLGKGWIVAGAGLLLALAFPARVLPATWDAMTSRLVLGLTLIPWVVLGRRYDRESNLDLVAVAIAWIAQLAVAILIIRAGARSGSRAWVNLGYLALLAGVITRYFDFFGDFLEGGVALALAGVVLLFVVYALEKARRRTLRVEAAA